MECVAIICEIFPCKADAHALVTLGCVHEHIGVDRPLCHRCHTALRHGSSYCTECVRSPDHHLCTQSEIETKPLTEASNGQTTPAAP